MNRNQHLQNRAFLKVLRRTGNIRLAARETGIAPSTMHTRRRDHPALAQEWDAAIVMADADFHAAGGRHAPVGGQAAAGVAATPDDRGHRTQGGEQVVVRRRDGSLQVRAAQPGKLTRQCEQAFLSALSATANVRLSAAAAGASVRAFYRRRNTNPAFAREMRLALTMGCERLEMAMLATLSPAACADDAWRHNDPPPIPAMTAEQALHLLSLHHKAVRQQAEPAHIKRRRGESKEAHSFRLAAMYRAKQAEAAEAFEIAEAARRAGHKRSPHEPESPVLPALDQVTGWSKATGRPRQLFSPAFGKGRRGKGG